MTLRFSRKTLAPWPPQLRWSAACFAMILLCQCGPTHRILVSVAEQRMLLMKQDELVAAYPVSTSRFTLGDHPGSKGTPLGTMKIAKMIGGGAPSGAVFKSRVRTGEILPPNAPGRDPIVTRILWLKGTEVCNRNTYRRYIYIHGTPEEWRIGTPASFGCIRMKSRDIIDLYNRVQVNTPVTVIPGHLPVYQQVPVALIDRRPLE